MHLSNRKARALAQQSRERGDTVVKRFMQRLDDIAASVADDMEREFDAADDDEPENDEGAEVEENRQP